MNPEVKAEWTTALRTEFAGRQGVGRLRRSDQAEPDDREKDTFCCLGVLCELYRRHHPEVSWREYGGDLTPSFELLHNLSYLPQEVVRWAGLHEPDPHVTVTIEDHERLKLLDRPTSGRRLSVLNDRGYTYDEIAAKIEESL